MKYLCLVYMENPHAIPDTECMTFGESLRASGRYLAAEALQPVHTATTVRVRDGKVSVSAVPSPRRRSSSQDSIWSRHAT